MRASQAGPATGLIGQILLLVALAAVVGLGWAGWLVGVTCAVVASVALAIGVRGQRPARLSQAGWITLGRVTLTVGIAALAADAFQHPEHRWLVVTLATVALATDAVDGWLARRTATASALGARFDGEADAFLILALSVYVARSAGWWVLAIGAARYLFLAAGWVAPWMRADLPPRFWRKVVAATQGIALTVAAADVLPAALARLGLVVALAMLAESFGRDVWWLWRHRSTAGEPRDAPVSSGPRRARAAAALTACSALFIWVGLVGPNRPGELTPATFARVPIEAVLLLAAAILLPTAGRRVLAPVAGTLLALVVLVKLLDFGFFTAFDRPFDPVDDWSYAGIGVETLQASVGRGRAVAYLVALGVIVVAVLVLSLMSVRRVSRIAVTHRRRVLPAAAAITVVWIGLRVIGAPAASADAAGLAVHEVRAVHDGVRDHTTFVRELRADRFRDVPAERLLTALRDKDVLLVFVEAYGRSALEDPAIAPGVTAVLERGDRQLRGAGYATRSGFLTSSTFGGLSWLAHSTVQAGVWVDSNRRYDRLVSSDRFTLSRAFKRAGWRVVDQVPSNDRDWPEGTSFYGFDAIYDRRNVGYRGPKFGYAAMPDQYTLLALQRLELAATNRRPVFAEVDLVSSHIPWTRIPRLVDWADVGDGSIFHRLPADESSQAALFSDPDRARAAFGRSIEYSLSAVFSFVERYGDENLVLIVLGDHQPASIVSGEGASRDVPISIIAHDPAVMARIAGWGWEPGVRPGPGAPVWRMDAFRDRFLDAFGAPPQG